MNSLLKTAGVPGRAQGRLTVTQLADGVLKYSILQRGKRTPRDRGTIAFIPLEYDICMMSHHPRHLLGIWYDIMSRAMVVGC